MWSRRDLFRTAALIGGAAMLGPVMSACGSQPGGNGQAAKDIEYVAAEVSRAAGSAQAGEAASRAVTEFTADLYASLSSRPGNLVLSPYSVVVALAMTRNGAKGQTASEMDEVLHAGSAVLNDGLAWLDQALRSRAGRQKNQFDKEGDVALAIANSLWGQAGTTWKQPFLETLARDYGTGMRAVDFGSDTEGAREQINGWVEDNTNDRIQDLLPQGAVDALTRLVLVNAIWFKAPWFEPFEEDRTQDLPFTRPDGSTVDAPLMAASLGSAGYAEGDGWTAASIPYAGRALAMAVVVPEDPTGLPDLEESLTDGGLGDLLGSFQTAGAVDVLLPRWTSRTGAQLKEALRALGMPTAFDEEKADLSAMTDDERLLISDAHHQGFIAVDEKGTEAAAATAVVVGTTSAPLEPALRVHADRPFLYVIHDTETRTPLFIGRVTDPTA